ncbi:hypothetical protein ASPSYDRAFT_89315 [Aspergillus sydowii CBS 593.65]|uniref:Uncharacterized protein n=1 Tax=Aspergillus sydowii CBS 593.65 TaxID=1036612 RepID=A0A1L9TGQ7_9EURO|nr:uncharacterized protein ASPSYDRAFT_89315 [Aspergillus sydowii CBS 593.65]OJJ58575.1 hypothetical protein ASPSYDRAFT_89315 [Aspergillus sydowii CBS 593.65]
MGRTNKVPQIGQDFAGWYHAPSGKRYYGRGTINERGYTHDGSIYWRVCPTGVRPLTKFDCCSTSDEEELLREPDEDEPVRTYGRTGLDHEFVDPYVNDMKKSIMPEEDWPWHLRPFTDRNCNYSFRWRTVPDPSRAAEFGRKTPGLYVTANRMNYVGVGRALKPKMLGKEAKSSLVMPIPGKTDGLYQFFDRERGNNIPFWDMPRAPYPRWESGKAINREKWHAWFDNRPHAAMMPRLDDEHLGAYIAPDGHWYIGKGKVVATGLNQERRGFVYVEPQPGNEHNFVHPFTEEPMADFAACPRPGEGRLVTGQEGEKERHDAEQELAILKDGPAWSRWRSFPRIERIPELGEEYPGLYRPPKAPKREIYLGVGKVIKAGTTDRGRVFVESVPIPDKKEGNYQFFDPFTGKDMPDEYLP